MTPPPAAAAAPPHPRPARPATARPVRRASGPAGGVRRAATTTAAAGAPARAVPRGPRPVRRSTAPAPALRHLRALPDHRLLERLTGGRAWIGLIGFLLIGIVFMQVSLLDMNAGIGRSVEKASELERMNAALRAGNARLGSGDRIRAAAARKGLVDPEPGTVRFLLPGPADPEQAVKVMRPPGAADATVLPVTTAAPTYAVPEAVAPVSTVPADPAPTTATTTSSAPATEPVEPNPSAYTAPTTPVPATTHPVAPAAPIAVPPATTATAPTGGAAPTG